MNARPQTCHGRVGCHVGGRACTVRSLRYSCTRTGLSWWPWRPPARSWWHGCSSGSRGSSSRGRERMVTASAPESRSMPNVQAEQQGQGQGTGGDHRHGTCTKIWDCWPAAAMCGSVGLVRGELPHARGRCIWHGVDALCLNVTGYKQHAPGTVFCWPSPGESGQVRAGRVHYWTGVGCRGVLHGKHIRPYVTSGNWRCCGAMPTCGSADQELSVGDNAGYNTLAVTGPLRPFACVCTHIQDAGGHIAGVALTVPGPSTPCAFGYRYACGDISGYRATAWLMVNFINLHPIL